MSFAVFGHRSLYRFTVVFVFVRAWSFHFFSIMFPVVAIYIDSPLFLFMFVHLRFSLFL